MAAHTGENEQGLRKVMDWTRFMAVVILLLHFYYYCYALFRELQWTNNISDRILLNITRTGLFKTPWISKSFALGLLLLSMVGVRGKKSQRLHYKSAFGWLLPGLILYLCSGITLYLGEGVIDIPLGYIGITTTGFFFVLTGGSLFTRIIRDRLQKTVFNSANETFPQEEQLIQNDYSLNLTAEYTLNGKLRKSWVNFVNARRGLLILGSPGSGKSYFIIEPVIRQIIQKGQALFVFDHKFPDLSTLTYNCFLRHRNVYPTATKFGCINFSRPELSSRCNPIDPRTLTSLTAAIESSKSLLLSMNKTWVNKQGDFFVESPINLLAAAIWFLKKYGDESYCTIPHAIELLHVEYDKLFMVLQTELELTTIVNPFVQAFKDGEMETLNSQMSSVKIPLGRISSPEFYYILSGNDLALDINNPTTPAVLCLGNDPANQEALAPIMSLYIDRLNKLINQPGRFPSGQVIDEFATIRATSVMRTIATGRSNNITTVIALQDYSQLKMVYSREEAEVIFNITGNIISGQVSGETAKLLSERFAKTFQDRESISINSNDTSISRSRQLEQSIPASTISSLSSGEFVGLVADNPTEPIELKTFHCKLLNQHDAIKNEKENFYPLPVVRKVSQKDIDSVYQLIKLEVQDIIENCMEEILNNPQWQHLLNK